MKSNESVTPQGSLPFYEEGFDSRRFEQFVLDFLNTGIELPSVVAGSEVPLPVTGAQKRAKEGVKQDGVDIVAELHGGERWGFECKHYKRWDLGDTKKVVKNAEFEASRYVLVLACEVDKDVQDYILNLPNWDLWTPSRLTSLLKVRAPRPAAFRLVANYFSDTVARQVFPLHDGLLVSGEEYFRKYLTEGRLFHHRSPLVGRDRALADIKAFCGTENKKKVLILKARGGEGKSRLLAEFGNWSSSRAVRFVNPLAPTATAASSIGEMLFDQAVIVQDDAHRLENLRQEIVAQIVEHDDAKLIVTTRPQAVDALRKQLFEAGIDSTQIVSRSLELPRLSSSQMLELSEAVLGAEYLDRATNLAAWSERSPLICVVGGGLIRNGLLDPLSITTALKFRDEVFRRFESENLAGAACPDHLKNDLRNLLRLTALISPATENDHLFDHLESFFGWRPEEIEERLTYLKAAELIVETNQGLRIDPDLLGDHLVYTASLRDGEPTKFIGRVVQQFGSDYWSSMLRNLSEVEWRARADQGDTVDITEALWKRFAQEYSKGDWMGRSNLLDNWAKFAVFQPKRSLELVDLALSDTSERTDVIAKLVQVVEPAATWSEEHQLAALERLWSISKRLPTGGSGRNRNSRSSVWECISGLINFNPGWSQKRSLNVLAWIESLFERPDDQWLRETHHGFLNLVLSKAFSREGNQVISENGRMRHIAYRLVPKVGARIRSQAFQMIRNRLLAHSPIACGNAVDSLREAMKRIVMPYTERQEKRITPEERNRRKERDAWRETRQEALALLNDMLLEHDDPFLKFRIHRTLLGIIKYEEDEKFLVRLMEVYESVEKSFEFDLCRVVLGDVDDEFGEELRPDFTSENWRASGHYEASLERLRIFAGGMASDLLTRFPDNSALDTWIQQFDQRAADSGFSSLSWHHLVRSIGQANRTRAEKILNEIFDGRHNMLGRWANVLIGTFPKERHLEWVRDMLRSDHDEVFAAAIHLLDWSQHGDFPPEIWQQIFELAEAGSDDRQRSLAKFAASHFYRGAELSLKLIAMLPLRVLTLDVLSEILPSIAHLCEEDLAQVKDTVWEKLCTALVEVPQLDHSWQGMFLIRLNQHRPRNAFNLYRARIEHSESADLDQDDSSMWSDWGSGYSPLPSQFGLWGLHLESEPDFQQIASDLLERTSTENSYYWKKLLWVAVIKTSKTGADLIVDRIDQVSNSEALLDLIGLISHEGSLFVFGYPAFVTNALRIAADFSADEQRRVRVRLLQSALHVTRTISAEGAGREEEHGTILEEARQAKIRHLDDPILSAFYEDIISVEKREREDFRRWFDESDSTE